MIICRIAAVLLSSAGALHGATCAGLTRLTIPNTTVASATEMPAHCRVAAVAHPVAGSEIHIEIWLPAPEAWNGKFVGTGNGGYSSALSRNEMESALRKGYATAGSDTGHEGGDLKFAIGHPERIDDWGWRAIHVMTETAKLILRGYYGKLPAQSYFSGCSTGGHQALSEAQRFPSDYDGIVAGDPGNNRVRLNIGFLWSWLAAHPEHGEPLTAAKLPAIHRAVTAACGAFDDPRACKFDPGALLCKAEDSASCLTASQVEAVRKIYSGARNPRTGEQIFAGWPRGSEEGWTAYFVGQREPARLDFWRYWVFDDPEWNPRSFDFDRDVAFADAAMPQVTAVNADLSAFANRGGKLIVYHGAADPVAPPEDSIAYYKRVQASMGAARSDGFLRFFLVPGMGHCNPITFDALGAMDQWVSGGAAPERLGTVERLLR